VHPLSRISDLQPIVTGFGTLITACLILWQLGRQKAVAKSDLLLKLSESAKSHDDIVIDLEKLRRPDTPDVDKKKIITAMEEKEYRNARAFLRFCEAIVLMLEREVVSDEEVFTLLAYRMLLATNSLCLQNEFLVRKDAAGKYKYNSAFCSIYALDHRIHVFLMKVATACNEKPDVKLMDLRFDPSNDLRRFLFYEAAVSEYHSRRVVSRRIFPQRWWD
jgi:hypothetical protein